MYLDLVNYELNKKINDFVCNSNDATTPEESIDILNQAWELLPKPATQFVEPTSAIACGISENYKKLGDYQKALEWMLIALEARKDEPAAGVFIWTGIVYYELGDMENAYKYFDLTYNELRYTPFSMEDKKYWQFYKQRKEELNPKKKTKSKIRYFQTIFFVPYLTTATPTWTRAKNIERLNPKRTIYTDGTNFYSLDTQHGRFEKLNKKGKHMGEVDMCLNERGK